MSVDFFLDREMLGDGERLITACVSGSRTRSTSLHRGKLAGHDERKRRCVCAVVGQKGWIKLPVLRRRVRRSYRAHVLAVCNLFGVVAP